MTYTVRTITPNEYPQWEQFLLAQEHPQFLQSSQFTAVHEAQGEETFILGVFAGSDADAELVGGALVAVIRAKRGSYLFMQYGPVIAKEHWQNAFSAFSEALVAEGKARKVDFLRSSPFIANSAENTALYSAAGWKRAPIHMLAEHIWWLDITPSEDELMKGMRKTMRNLVRRAGKDGVTVRMGTAPEDVEIFIGVHEDTYKRHGFVPYKNEYFYSQVRSFADAGQVAVFIAEYEGKAISSSIVMYYGTMASYHHGASLSEYRKVPASYLMQWTAIQEARRRGCTVYNFWGIAPEGQDDTKAKKPHPFAGVTKFKRGWGGELYNILPCQDKPLTLAYYYKTRLIETVRRIKRGF